MRIRDIPPELAANCIRPGTWSLIPLQVADGVLCLLRDSVEDRWRVVLTERGMPVIDEHFYTEHDACRYFLKHILLDPSYHSDVTQQSLEDFLTRKRQEIRERYGFGCGD